MRSKLLIVSMLSGLLPSSQPAWSNKCYGLDPCDACHTCNYCKHCNSGGNPCGVLLDERGRSKKEKAAPVKRVRRKQASSDSQSQEFEAWGLGLPRGKYKLIDGKLVPVGTKSR